MKYRLNAMTRVQRREKKTIQREDYARLGCRDETTTSGR